MMIRRLEKAFSLTLPAFYFFIFLCNYCNALQDDSSTINIYVNTTADTLFDRYKISFGTTKILIRNIPQDDGFFLIQVHSFAQEIILTNGTSFNLHSSVSGTNVGLVKILLPTDATKTFPFYLRANQSGTVLIAVTVYSSSDPIPGGCSMTFNTDIAPYLNLTYTNALIDVKYQDASLFRHICEENVVRLEMYRMFVAKNDLSSDNYFDNIQKMLTVDDIRKNGENITENGVRTSSLRKYLSGYMGLGQIIAVVGVSGDRSAAYVPAVTYSCNVTNGPESCYEYNDIWWLVLTCIVLIYGIAMFFAEDMMGISISFLTLGITTYVLYNILIYATNISNFVLIICIAGCIISLSIISACTCGMCLKKPEILEMISHCLTSVLCGLCIGTLVVTRGWLDMYSSAVYWGLFAGMSVVMFILIFCSSFINPFAYNLMAMVLIMTSCSYLSGGTTHHIVTEVIRQMTVEHYDVAVKMALYNITIVAALILIALFRSICSAGEGRRPIKLRIVRYRVDRINYTQI